MSFGDLNFCGVRLWMLRPERQLVPAVNSLNLDGFNILDETPWQCFLFFPTRHCIQFKLSQETLVLSVFIILRISQHYVDKNHWLETLPFPPMQNSPLYGNSTLKCLYLQIRLVYFFQQSHTFSWIEYLLGFRTTRVKEAYQTSFYNILEQKMEMQTIHTLSTWSLFFILLCFVANHVHEVLYFKTQNIKVTTLERLS